MKTVTNEKKTGNYNPDNYRCELNKTFVQVTGFVAALTAAAYYEPRLNSVVRSLSNYSITVNPSSPSPTVVAGITLFGVGMCAGLLMSLAGNACMKVAAKSDNKNSTCCNGFYYIGLILHKLGLIFALIALLITGLYALNKA